MSDDFHLIQRRILNNLLFNDKLRYSEIKPGEMEGSQFTFHLNKLIEIGLVEKADDQYTLTANGKTIANSFDTDSVNPRRQAKHSVVFCAFRTSEGKIESLIYTRKKNPYYDHQGFPTGKVMYGESIITTAERELKEETNLSGIAVLIGIRHFRVYYPKNSDLVEDKVMYICKIENPKGELANNIEGEFKWIKFEHISKLIAKPLPEFEEVYKTLLTYVTSEGISFKEISLFPSEF